MSRFGDLAKKLLHIEDSPERTALAYSIGVFLGFSPFLGLHTLSGVAIAFLFNLNRVAVLLGVWSNTPWWIVPYYTVATWIGMEALGSRIDLKGLKQLLQSGEGGGFSGSAFWTHLGSQWDLLLAFMVGSLIFAAILAGIAYPLSLRWIKFYRARRN